MRNKVKINKNKDIDFLAKTRNHKVSVIDEAFYYKELIDNYNLSQASIATKFGISQGALANKLRLLKLPPYILDALKNKTISERHGRALLKAKAEDLKKVFDTIVIKKYTVKETEEYLNKLYNNSKKVKGYAGNVLLGVNSIKKVYQMCLDSGLDCTINEVEYEQEVKIIIKFKK